MKNPSMHKVGIIGAGQLGSRHLQGLARVDVPLSIHLLDPSAASLAVAQSRFEEIPGASAHHELHLCQDVAQWPDSLDLVISATTADHRLSSLSRVLAHATVHNLVLEKVLFQRLDEYPRAAELLRKANARAWVNCARRMFPAYQDLKAFFANEEPYLLVVSGGNWGLGCNGIHFCDLFAYLNDADDIAFDTALLDKVMHESKRPGFVEFTGTLAGRQGPRQLILQSRIEPSPRHLVTIRSATRTAVIDEVGGVMHLLDETGGNWIQQPFSVLYQSQLTTTVARDILTGREPCLPTFDSSSKLHLAFLTALMAHASEVSGEQMNHCPVT